MNSVEWWTNAPSHSWIEHHSNLTEENACKKRVFIILFLPFFSYKHMHVNYWLHNNYWAHIRQVTTTAYIIAIVEFEYIRSTNYEAANQFNEYIFDKFLMISTELFWFGLVSLLLTPEAEEMRKLIRYHWIYTSNFLWIDLLIA